MVGRRTVRLACSAVAGVALAAGLAGPAGAARAGAGVPPSAGSASGGIISTVAGGDGGPGPATSVAVSPCGVAGAGGWLYIGDGSMVRRVSAATGALTTVAGDNTAGPADDGGTAVSSAISQACGTVLDRAGNLVIADGLRVLVAATRTGTFYGRKMTAGDIYTIAGSGGQGSSGSGGPARKAKFEILDGVAADRHGNVVFIDTVSGVVWVVAVKDGTFYGQAMTADDVYIVAGGGASLGDGGPATSALLSSPSAVAVSPTGSLLVTDGADNRLRAISP